jgi:PAS domain S-box-containing protein
MPEIFIGKKLFDVLPVDVAELSFSMIQKTLETKELQTFEYELNNQDWDASFEARMVYKNASEVLVIIRDISEQKRALENLNKSEKLFRTLIDSTQEAVIAINSNVEVVIFNPAAEKMFQMSKSEIQDSGINSIIPDNYRIKHSEWVTSYFKVGKPDGAMGRILELQAKKNDGSLFDVEISISPGNLEEERIVVAVIRDITLRKKAEKTLLEAKEKAIENDRLKSAFLANMSHEIRTPMNSILGFSNLLPEAESEVERDEYIKIIISNGHLLMNLINDIIDISKIEAGLTKSFKTSFLIKDKMENIYDLFSVNKKCVSGQVELKMNMPSELNDETLFTDKTKFSQILINLVNNALKFTEKGVVEFGFYKEEINGKPMFGFYVKDTGIGITKSDQELIFDRFRQVDVIDRNAYGGTGLGLSICQSFAKLLGGDIYVESEEGKGSSFFFHLPDVKEKKQFARTLPKVEFTGFSNWRGKKILVVEDNDANYMIFNAYLKETGLELLWAKTGEEAVEYCKKNNSIDLILMDIKLPGMDGYEATKRIRAIGKKIPIIAQTAYAMDSDRQRSVDAGCDNFISKPILKDKLYNMLSNYLN